MAYIIERFSDDEWEKLWELEIKKMIADNADKPDNDDKPDMKSSHVTPQLIQITPVAAAQERAKAAISDTSLSKMSKVLTKRKRAKKITKAAFRDYLG